MELPAAVAGQPLFCRTLCVGGTGRAPSLPELALFPSGLATGVDSALWSAADHRMPPPGGALYRVRACTEMHRTPLPRAAVHGASFPADGRLVAQRNVRRTAQSGVPGQANSQAKNRRGEQNHQPQARTLALAALSSRAYPLDRAKLSSGYRARSRYLSYG